MAAHPTIISSGGKEGLAPSPAQPRKYPRNVPRAQQMHPPHMTEGYNSLTETKKFKPAKDRKKGEETKSAQCNGWRPPVQESVQENRVVDRKIHANATEGESHKKKKHECEEQLCMKQTMSLSVEHDVFGEGGAEDILPTDDASWEVIDYPSDPI